MSFDFMACSSGGWFLNRGNADMNVGFLLGSQANPTKGFQQKRDTATSVVGLK